jgi:hypothetical protein
VKSSIVAIEIIALLALAILGCDMPQQAQDRGHPPSSSKPTAIVPDTRENWDEFVTIMNLHIADERKGENPPGGIATWTEHWKIVIRELEKGQENPARYVHYIVRARARAGLPTLPDDKTSPQS